MQRQGQTNASRAARSRSPLRAFVLASAAALLSGCAPYGGSGERLAIGSQQPAWVQDLREPLQDLPILPAETAPLPQGDGSRSRVGQPQDLTGPLRSASPDVSTQQGPSRGSNGSGNGSGGVHVTINNAATEDQPEARPRAASSLELHYAGDAPTRPDRSIRQFGYEQIERMAAPIGATDGPASPDHIVSTGDELLIDLTTDLAQRFRSVVDSDGNIEITELGSFSVAGVRFQDLQRHLQDQIAVVRRNFTVSVSLGRLASVPVRVVGEVIRPGVVEAGPRPTVLDALGAAGIRKSGSLRGIVLNRADGSRETLDLYPYLIGGQREPDIRLSRGDSLTVPPIGPTIGIAGSVQRPGIFESLPGAVPTLDSALAWAGGITGFALEQSIQIERTQAGKRILVDVDPDNGIELQDSDLLLIGAVDGRLHPIVQTSGELARPGRFQFREGMTVADLIRMSGGLTVNAFDAQAVISRQTGAASLRGLVWDADPSGTSRRVIIVDLARAAAGDPQHDLPLEPLDMLSVPRFDEAVELPTVEAIGAVRRPGTFELTAGLHVGDLIALAGNPAPDAFREEAELIRRLRASDGSLLDVLRYRINLVEILDGSTRGPALQTGDRLILRALTRSEVRVSAAGNVRFPGEYVLPAGSKITDLIAAAGGLLPTGDLRAARFTRDSVRRLQLDNWEQLTERTRQTFERNLERRVNGSRSKEALSALLQLNQSTETLQRLSGQQTLGRIVLPLDREDFPQSESNLALESGDALFVPRMSETVTVQGHVFNPVTVVQEGEVSADDLISLAGGLTETADKDRIYVVRANGMVEGIEQRGGRFRLAAPLHAGDVVLVPPEPLGRDPGSVIFDALLMARTAGEAAALWNLATGSIEDGSLSIIDSPASQRSDSISTTEIIDEYRR